jgi:amino acid transporter
MGSSENGNQPVKARLGLIDASSIIVGIIIGSTIFTTPPEVFQSTPNAWVALGLWAIGGVLAFIGALCYAELATAYPRLGGDYNYLTRAYGPLLGYLFGWAQLAVVQTSSIGLMAYIFADYTKRYADETKLWELKPFDLFGLELTPTVLYASGAVLVVTLLNLLGVVFGKLIQNLLTFIKLLGLGAIVVVGFFFATSLPEQKQGTVFRGELVSRTENQIVVREPQSQRERTVLVSPQTRITKVTEDEHEVRDEKTGRVTKVKNRATDLEPGQVVTVYLPPGALAPTPALQVKTPAPLDLLLLLAGPMVAVMLAYGGWNDAAFVAAEVRNRDRNIPRALLWGTALVTVIYLLVCGAYVYSLGFDRAAGAENVAADVLEMLPGEVRAHAVPAICVLVMVSALGAVNGLTFTSSRIYATLGADYSLLAPLGRWNRARGTPFWALLLSLLITLTMIVAFGTKQGREGLNNLFEAIGVGRVGFYAPGGFLPLLQCQAPVFWLFFLLSGLALFVLRLNEPQVPRPFRVPLYPVVPLLFCATCAAMLYSGINFAKQLALVGAALVLLGTPLYIFSRRRNVAAGLAPEPAEQSGMSADRL